MNSKSFVKILKYEWRQFCMNTTLHGWKFTILPGRSKIEKLLWFLICMLAMTSALTLLLMSWLKFSENPTTLVTDATKYPIYHYPFPAVTICSFNKISKKKAKDLAKQLSIPYTNNISNANQLFLDLRVLSQLINMESTSFSERDYLKVQEILDYNQKNVDQVLNELSPSCDDMLHSCKWKGESQKCNSIFEKIKTSDGYCCSFNYFAMKNHTFSREKSRRTPKEPRRISACGYQTGLEVLLDSLPHDYFATYIPSTGFRVLIHDPYYFPDGTVQDTLVSMKTNNFIAINPEITRASKNVRTLLVSKRHCLFSDEQDLLYFHNYNFHNCIVECQMNLTKEYCGCTPFYYINDEVIVKRTIRMCTLRDIECLKENEGRIFSAVPGFDFSSVDKNHVFGTEKSECNCLPDCEFADYFAESSAGIFDSSFSPEMELFTRSPDVSNQSVVRIFFDDLVGQKNRMDVVFTWHSLLAYYGGILGLLTGFSFISVVEIVYFFTVRLIADSAKTKEQNKGSKQAALEKTGKHRAVRSKILNGRNLTILKQEQEIHRREGAIFSFVN